MLTGSAIDACRELFDAEWVIRPWSIRKPIDEGASFVHVPHPSGQAAVAAKSGPTLTDLRLLLHWLSTTLALLF